MPIRSNLAFLPKFLACSLRNQAVELETTMIDVSGKPVHEECHVQKVSAHSTIPIQGDPNHKVKSNTHNVIEILNTTAARPVSRFCPLCGSRLECHEATFFYQDRARKIPLTNCVKCDPPTKDFS